MPENPSPALPETPVESAASRAGVMQSFNDAAFRWEVKISTLHNQINPYVEIDKLKGTDSHTPGQEREVNDADLQKFAKFRTFTQGIRGLNASPHPILFDSQPSDTLTVSFKNAQTGEVIHRQEGPDISGLIESAKEDVRLIQEQLAQSVNSPQMRSQLEEQLQTYQKDVQNLEANSVPYIQEIPDALNEANPVEKGRITEEARRIWDYPLTRKPAMEEDWAAAKDRLQNARLLKIPKKTISEPKPYVSPVPPLQASTGINNPWLNPEPVIPQAPILEATPPIPTPKPIEEHKTIKTGEYISPKAAPKPADTFRTEVIDSTPVSEGRIPSEVTEKGFISKIRKLFKDSSEESTSSDLPSLYKDIVTKGATTAAELTERINEYARKLHERGMEIEPVVARKVERLTKIKIPEIHRKDLRFLLLPAAAILLALCNPADTKAVPKPSVPPSGGAPSTPAPEFKPPVPLPPSLEPYLPPIQPKQPYESIYHQPFLPKTMDEFRNGVGYRVAGEADYTQGDDYQEKLDPDNPNRDINTLKGYSVRGLTEAEIAYFMNPYLNQRERQRLLFKGEIIPPDDEQLNKTLILLKEKFDAYYGEGTYQAMIDDFTERMKAVITQETSQRNPAIHPILNDKIIEGRFYSWSPTDEETDRWFELKTANSGLTPTRWRRIVDDITIQLREEMKNQ